MVTSGRKVKYLPPHEFWEKTEIEKREGSVPSINKGKGKVVPVLN
jgi:hypothetical protein